MNVRNIEVGMSYKMRRVFTCEDVNQFAKLSYDTNPLHTDEQYAKTTQFKQIIVPGFLTASLFSAIIGTKMPGIGSIYLKQDMKFCRPVYLNQPITAVVEVCEIDDIKRRVLLSTMCYDENDLVLIEGSALVKLPEE